jgi:glycolate oxidase FAD binding subunit
MTELPEALAKLSSELAPGCLEPPSEIGLEGASPAATLAPRDPEELARAVAALAARGLAALVRGGGTRMGLGNPPRRADVVLSTRRIRGIPDFDAGEGVCRALAGTELSELRSAVNAGGWELPLDPPGRGSTVGGALAAAAIGPRALGFGLPRDLVLGLEVVLGDGARTRCGGRVVKNVTGYDLAKLYTGSLGSLGVIASAWLRLRPRPERVALLGAALPAAAGLALGLAAARRPGARAAAVELPAGGTAALVVELAGDAAVVEGERAWLAAETGAREAPPAALDRLRRLQAQGVDPQGLLFRLALRPSRLAAAAGELVAAGASLLAYPGLSLLFAAFPAGEAEGAFAAVAAAAGGSFVLERGPLAARAGRDAFGAAPGLLALTRALKARFDPAGVLNPGRLPGWT